jgi:hypothetical protein
MRLEIGQVKSSPDCDIGVLSSFAAVNYQQVNIAGNRVIASGIGTEQADQRKWQFLCQRLNTPVELLDNLLLT